ncbi:MAG: hypothetical protein ACYC27_04600 [Armatimonadota bacterium]
MKLIITLIIIATTCLPALCTETSKPTSELDKPVTMAVKGESLADIVQMMKKQTSAKLRVTKSIQEQKATIFVDKMPLRDVINGICTVFDFRFSYIPESKVYEIWEPEKNWKNRVNATAETEEEAWKRIETNIDKAITFSHLSPEARAKTIAEITGDTQDSEQVQLIHLYQSIDRYPFISMFIRLLDSDTRILQALGSGLSVHFDSRSTDPEWNIPKSVLDGLPALAKDHPDNGLPEILASYSKPNKDKFMCMHLGLSRDLAPNMRSVIVQSSFEYCRGLSYPYSTMMQHLVSADLGDRTTATVQVKLPQVGVPKFLDRKVSLTEEELVKEADLPDTVKPGDGIYMNRSDILGLLHKCIGMQAISDHYSFWHRMEPVLNQSVTEILDRFSRESLSAGTGKSSQEAVRGWDDKFFYMRIEQIALADSREIPNPSIYRWSDIFKKQGYLGLDELAEMIWLNDEQIEGLRFTARFHGLDATPLYQFETSNDDSLSHVSDSATALRLYGLLTKVQKQQAFAAGTRVNGFTKEQYMVLADMLNKVVEPENRFKAGIYNGEIRVDKRGTDNQMQPVMMQITGSSGNGYHYLPPKLPVEYIAADTPEKAWQQLLVKYPSAKKEDLNLLLSSHSYDFTVHMADGSNHIWNVSIDHKTLNYAEWEREQNSLIRPSNHN